MGDFTAKAKEKINSIDIPVKKTIDKIDIPVKKTVDGWSSKIKDMTHKHEDDKVPAATAVTDANGRIEININDIDSFDGPQPVDHITSRSVWNHPMSRTDSVVVKFDTPFLHAPPMHICIMIVGTRGDVQPFIGIGKRLKKDGHRVRLATHEVYRSMVLDGGLEFYPLGGDPKELAAYMVKTGGHLIPLGYDVITKDLPRNIQMVEEILFSTWPAVQAADTLSSVPPFRANAIISNPVTYGHIHVAEKLGVPLHIMFPQPWVPTEAFPHPLSNLAYTGKKDRKNYISYKMVDALMFQGTESMVNRFREDVLGLSKIRMGDSGRDILLDLRIPHSFMWSPHLVPCPDDWDSNLYDVIGTVCDESVTNYTPEPEFAAFLAAGPAPIFVGFGSMVIADTAKTTKMILEAAKNANVRVVIQSSWSDMTQGGTVEIPDSVFILGNCPHDWLLPRMAAVVHHGGAGTTAAGLLAGKPTFIVPFFGDQPFWGWAVVEAGVGVKPCPIAELSTEVLTEAFTGLMQPALADRAKLLMSQMEAEDGVENAVQSFYHHLPTPKMVCAFTPEYIATKWLTRDNAQVCDYCAFAIRSTTEQAIVDYHVMEYTRSGPASGWEGASSGAGAFAHEIGSSIVSLFAEPAKGYKKEGAKGAAIGAAKGIANFAIAPLNGIALFTDRVAVGHYNKTHQGEKQKSTTIDARRLFQNNDAFGSNSSGTVGNARACKVVAVSLTPKEQADIREKLTSLIAEKEKQAAENPEATVDENAEPDEEKTQLQVPVKVHSIEVNKSGEFHMSFEFVSGVEAVSPSQLLQEVDDEFEPNLVPPPPMNICIFAIGSSTEVEAFIAIGKAFAADGHHVRLCAHRRFEELVLENNLEFFCLQGNPTTVADWVAKASIKPTIDGPWNDLPAFLKSTWEGANGVGFRADLIVSQPAVIVHRYIAERLGIPVHLVSAFPWSPTSEFANPLMEPSPYQNEWSNWLSYTAIDEFMWKSFKPLLNKFRTDTLQIESWNTSYPPSWSAWRIPVTYLWSPSILPKPHDWPQEVDVVGFPELEINQELSGTIVSFFEGEGTYIYVNLHNIDLSDAMDLVHDVLEGDASLKIILHCAQNEHKSVLVSEEGRLCIVPKAVPVKPLLSRSNFVIHQATDDVILPLLENPKPSIACPNVGIERLWAEQLHLKLKTPKAKTLAQFKSIPKAVFSELLEQKAPQSSLQIREETLKAPRRVVESIYRNLPLKSMVCDILPEKFARVRVPKWNLKLSHEASFVGKTVWPQETELKSYHPVIYSLANGAQYVSMEHRNKFDQKTQSSILGAFSSMLSADSTVRTKLFGRQESMVSITVDVSSLKRTPEQEKELRAQVLQKYQDFVNSKAH
ncbi:sterol 3-beta-glucosyltransferase [Thraustotheca clavata]|uniref:Sterol 3-beta-glucosyltransferase n=1 Tax=Thraustotheca clavata TaxID=74557 RepID=A0A1W0AA11_9STRA|nr:sterol 3-beta-glucosyltransferase [Thraustotheca clavata]